MQVGGPRLFSVMCRLVKNSIVDSKYCILGNSPHPSTPDEDEGQAELLIAEEKLSPEDDGQVMPRLESTDTQDNVAVCNY